MKRAQLPLIIKQAPEDFVVEELPGFAPSGAGEHLYLFVEKVKLSTTEVAQHLARVLERGPHDVGFAGRKDRNAVARQWFSVWGVPSEHAAAVEREGLRVLRVTRHEQKLRLGALAGNRFDIVVRGVGEQDRHAVDIVLLSLREHGLSNRFGPQRFGADGHAQELGRLALARDWRGFASHLAGSRHWPASAALEELRAVLARDGQEGHRGLGKLAARLPRELAPLARQLARRRGDFQGAVRALERSLVTFGIAAFQAYLFNQVLDLRGERLTQPLVGDLMQRHPGRGFFEVDGDEDLTELQLRVERGEISPTGPMFGWKAPLAEGEPGAIERQVLAAEGLEPERFRRLLSGVSPEGSRRSLRALVGELTADWRADSLRLCFTLPPGSYATTLVRELAQAQSGGSSASQASVPGPSGPMEAGPEEA